MLTRDLLVMETEVTRQMWADLKAVRSNLPSDPSDTSRSPSMDHPVQRNNWYEAVLFANLLSLERDLVPCYYKDGGFTVELETNQAKDLSLDWHAFGGNNIKISVSE